MRAAAVGIANQALESADTSTVVNGMYQSALHRDVSPHHKYSQRSFTDAQWVAGARFTLGAQGWVCPRASTCTQCAGGIHRVSEQALMTHPYSILGRKSA